MERGIYLVSGIPGAGKTTIARLLAQRFERGAHIESDELQRFIVRGGVWPDGQPSFAGKENLPRGTTEEGGRQLRLRCRNACLLADSFYEAGFTPVIDDIVIGDRFNDFISDVQSRPLYFVLLTPALEVANERDALRPDKHVGHAWDHLDAVMREERHRR